MHSFATVLIILEVLFSNNSFSDLKALQKDANFVKKAKDCKIYVCRKLKEVTIKNHAIFLWKYLSIANFNQLTYTIMKRVFNELTPECEITARMYAQGYEKKEIANLKCRAVSTINNQLQRAFEILNVRNGRELATMLYERIAGMKFTMDFSPTIRSAVAFCLLCIFSFSLYHEQGDMRRGRRTRVERIERTGRYGGKTWIIWI